MPDWAVQSQVLTAEGERQAAILRTEGQRQAQILQAEGQSQAIEIVFQALPRGEEEDRGSDSGRTR